jgi:cbb3-type cytochrome oxidase maturation protein
MQLPYCWLWQDWYGKERSMNVLIYLIPAALFLGGVGLCAFLWVMKSGQFEDLDGASLRIFADDPDGL